MCLYINRPFKTHETMTYITGRRYIKLYKYSWRYQHFCNILLGPPEQSNTKWVNETIKMYCLTVLHFRSLKLRHGQGHFLPLAMKENLFYSSFLTSGGLLVVFSIPWHSVSLDGILPVCVCPNFPSL